jgi:uncharacterized protein with von Willebrand factor type A (vWA) domain
VQISDRDYTLIIDKSGSMLTPDQPDGKSRWVEVQASTMALARQCEQFDPDGITVYVFSGRFRRYDGVTSRKVENVFIENDPGGTTNLAAVLLDATEMYFKNKAAGKLKPDGETILVITDGAPDDRRAVMEVLVNATQKMQRDEQLAISFIQVGSDPQATKFLKALDQQLQGVGAKFDICHTLTVDEMGEMSLSEVLLKAITD